MNRILRQKIADASLLGLALSSGIAVAVTGHWQTARLSDETFGALIPALAEAEPSSLQFTKEGKSVRIAHRERSGELSAWVVESPWKRAAESSTVDGAITGLRDMQLVRKIQTGPQMTTEELTRFGLERPIFSWQVQIESSTWTVAFGAEAPQPRGGTYVDVVAPNSSTHKVYVAIVDLAKLSLAPEQLVEPRLVPYVPSDFGTVAIESGAGRVNFRFDGARSRWFEAGGQHYRISRTAIDSFLLQLTTLKASRFLTPSEAATKHWTKNGFSVTLGLSKSQATVRLEFGAPCSDGSFVSVSGAEQFEACADTRALLPRLELQAPEWVDSKLFSVRPDEVESLELKHGAQTSKLERWESGFRVTEHDVQALDLETGNRVLSVLLKVGGKLTNAPSAGTFENASVVTVRSAVIGDTDKYEERVVVGPALTSGDRFARREVDGALLRVPASEASSLLLDENRLKELSASRELDAGAE